ncbi:hypothetical protein M0R45_018869 [Rubus argutus]|uniref:Uncharacterized protein n=1 Tax=Rubus argutus TaxID=59490 RepID=A0AAW1X475_RUBAR
MCAPVDHKPARDLPCCAHDLTTITASLPPHCRPLGFPPAPLSPLLLNHNRSPFNWAQLNSNSDPLQFQSPPPFLPCFTVDASQELTCTTAHQQPKLPALLISATAPFTLSDPRTLLNKLSNHSPNLN